MRWKIFLIVGLFLLISSFLSGQGYSGTPLKKKSLKTIESCQIKVDEHTLLPHSVLIIFGRDTFDQILVKNNVLTLPDSLCNLTKYDTITFDIQYRTFGFNVEKPYFTIDSSLLTFKEKALITAYEYRPADSKNALIESKGLDYRGSFSRGLSVGNSQSLVLNSNFDMQLIGDLGNGLKVVAAISDENLPIQAQGNTQQLQEFEQLFGSEPL